MLQAFVITFREGLEAFLIVAISLAFLRKSGSRHLIPAVKWGIALSAVISVVAGWLFSLAANQALWEGVLALVAATAVASLTVHMWRTARHIKGDIEHHLRRSPSRASSSAWVGMLLFTVLMISREGMETALLIGTIVIQVRALDIIVGAVAGTSVAAIVAWLWSRYGHRINLGRFLQVTAIFLFIFVLQLLIDGFLELTEANVLPISEALYRASQRYGPDGLYGQYLSYLLIAGPLGWWVIAMVLGHRRTAQGRVAHVSR